MGNGLTVSDERVIGFGRRIRMIRKSKSLSQEGLAALAELDRSYMGHVERGEKNVTIRNVFKIADALDVHPGKLFE